MRTAIVILMIVCMCPSCFNDNETGSAITGDSVLYDEADVDTFRVGRNSEVLSSETPEGESLKIANDTSIAALRQELLEGTDSEGENITVAEIVRNPDVGPSFPGGSAAMDVFVAKNLVYPLVAFQNDIIGTVHVRFVVETDGRITGIMVKKKLGYGCDESATDLIASMPKWVPGRKGGRNVRCEVVLPLTFGKKDPY